MLFSILLKSLYFSKIKAQEKIEAAIKIIMTLLTTKSARTKSCINEKSVDPPNPQLV